RKRELHRERWLRVVRTDDQLLPVLVGLNRLRRWRQLCRWGVVHQRPSLLNQFLKFFGSIPDGFRRNPDLLPDLQGVLGGIRRSGVGREAASPVESGAASLEPAV